MVCDQCKCTEESSIHTQWPIGRKDTDACRECAKTRSTPHAVREVDEKKEGRRAEDSQSIEKSNCYNYKVHYPLVDMIAEWELQMLGGLERVTRSLHGVAAETRKSTALLKRFSDHMAADRARGVFTRPSWLEELHDGHLLYPEHEQTPLGGLGKRKRDE